MIAAIPEPSALEDETKEELPPETLTSQTKPPNSINIHCDKDKAIKSATDMFRNPRLAEQKKLK